MKVLIKKTFVLLLAAVIMTAGFGLTLDQASAATGPTSINLKVASGTGTAAVVDISGKVKVYVSSVYPSTRSKSVTWSVYSGTSYGKISSTSSSYCYVQGIKAGKVTIKAKSKYYPYAVKYITVYVKQLYPTKITLNRTSLHMWKDASSTLTATVTPSWVYPGVNWTTSNSDAATVSTAGKVTGKGGGTTTITATSKEKSTIKASCSTKVYAPSLTTAGRVDTTIAAGDVSNPVNVAGPTTTKTITYASSNPSAVTVNTSGVIHPVALGSSTITATLTIPAITEGTKVKTFKYYANVKSPVDAAQSSFNFDETWSKLEIVGTSDGFMGNKSLLFSKENLDDFFGFGSLGVDLWNPMDMYKNFMSRDIAWHVGGFTFDKTGTNVKIATMINQNVWTSPYVLSTTDSLVMKHVGADQDIVTGYDLKFFYTSDTKGGFDQVSLDGDVLTVPFGSDTLGIQRLGYNKIQILADADNNSATADTVVMSITRTTSGYTVAIVDKDYMTSEGISFNLFKTYL